MMIFIAFIFSKSFFIDLLARQVRLFRNHLDIVLAPKQRLGGILKIYHFQFRRLISTARVGATIFLFLL